jgi:RNA-directed DNA polymerase
VNERSQEDTPALVSEETKQAVDVRARWAWAEPAVWTERMLEALETGLRGGKWFSLHDKAFSVRALRAAFAKVKSNKGAPGVDGWTIYRFESDLENQILKLAQELRSGVYRPSPVKRVWIPKPGTSEKRPLGIPTIRDRVVQTALRSALEPIFEQDFSDLSYGFRPGRSCHKALRRVWNRLKKGDAFVVDADLQSFFDSIPHEVIMRGVEAKIADGRILNLLQAYLVQGVMENGSLWTANEGTPQGAVISPLLANIALHGLDTLAQEQGLHLVRYADDFVILCKDRMQAEQALEVVMAWTDKIGLRLHPDKTEIVDYGSGEAFEFLGYKFQKGKAFPRNKSQKKFRDRLRALTPRANGRSMQAVIGELNPFLRGFYNYFRHSYKTAFVPLDQMVRRRLRAILGHRRGIRRFSKGNDNVRWPNAFFHELGLFSMVQANLAHQSSRKANC